MRDFGVFRNHRVRSQRDSGQQKFEFRKLEDRKLLSADLGNADKVCFLDEIDQVSIVDSGTTSFKDSGNGGGSARSNSVVADYVDDFTRPNVPAGWQYLWNSDGEFGSTANYSGMTWESWRYHPDSESFPYLGATFAHPGPGLDDANSGGIERFAIAAFTVDQAGTYEISNSSITREGANGDGVEVSVHVNDLAVTSLLQLAPSSSGSFNHDLGLLQVGDTIYVGLGPDGPGNGSSIGNDGVAWDFSIELSNALPDSATVTVDLETQRFVGDVSTLDREKFFTFHATARDQQIADFMSQYDVQAGRQFWGPFPYAKNQTGVVGQYPDLTPSTDQSVRPTYPGVQTSHPRDAIRYDMDLQAAADWVTTYYTTVVDEVPEFFEPMNEPFVHAGDPEFSDAPDTDAMRLQMAQLFGAIGEAVNDTPALVNMNVVGYSSAWPSVELWDFGHWDSRMKMFMDVAGEHMDAFSTHLYDGVNVTGQNNRRSGSNSEAILDLIETYSFAKWGFVKPHAITEYGGIETGFGDTYTDIRSAQSLRSINHLLFNLLEREDDMLISIPFITGKAEWFLDSANNCEPYGATLWRPSAPSGSDCGAGGFEYTWRVNFYELWENVQGERGLINTSDPDVQAQLFVDGNTAYVAVNNLSDNTSVIDLDFVSGLAGLQNVEIRQMEVPVDVNLQPTYTETTQSTAPSDITLETGGTAVLVYNFDSDLAFTNTIEAEKYYTAQHLQPINANQVITFNINDVQTAAEGEATLRMGIGRKHDVSKTPVIEVNGTVVPVPNDWKGYDQANRDDFFGVIDIPVPISLLSQNNTITATFPDSGGRVSSMILEVEAVVEVPELDDVMVNLGESGRSDVNQLTLNFTGLVDFGANPFSVVQRSDASGTTGTEVDTSFTSQNVNGATIVTLTFDSLTRNSAGSLLDGNYQLTVNAAEVTATSSGAVMVDDFIFGDTEDESFYAFYGDSDGNRNVNVFDLLSFRQTYRASTGDSNYLAAMDYEANGIVNVFDLLQFRQRYRESLAFS
jgi:hypothetical protein